MSDEGKGAYLDEVVLRPVRVHPAAGGAPGEVTK